jgi:DNA-binding CsgD family transcriptional regulator
VTLGRDAHASALPKGLIALGLAVHLAGDEHRALALVAEGLARSDAADDPYGVVHGLVWSGLITLRLNDLERATAFQEQALAMLAEVADEPWVAPCVSSVFGHLGNIAVARGDIDRAESYFAQALDRQQALGFAPGMSHFVASHPIAGQGDVARARGDHHAALTAYQTALRLAQRFNDTRAIVYALGGIAGALAAAGNWRPAARLFGATEALHEAAGIHFDLETMDRQRALGLPEPWYRGSDSFGIGQPLRETLGDRSAAIPPIPDPGAAAEAWAAGRLLSLDDAVAEAMAADILPTRSPVPLAGSPERLTPREVEVLRLLVAGKTDREIGETLFVSRRTAATHVARIFAKLGVSSRAAAAVWAVRHGIT